MLAAHFFFVVVHKVVVEVACQWLANGNVERLQISANVGQIIDTLND